MGILNHFWIQVVKPFVTIHYLSVQNHEVASSPFVHPQHKSCEAQSVQFGVIPQFRMGSCFGLLHGTPTHQTRMIVNFGSEIGKQIHYIRHPQDFLRMQTKHFVTFRTSMGNQTVDGPNSEVDWARFRFLQIEDCHDVLW